MKQNTFYFARDSPGFLSAHNSRTITLNNERIFLNEKL